MEESSTYIEKNTTAKEGNSTFLEGVKAAFPIVIGYCSVGFAAGIIGITAGLSVLEIVLMSFIVYAGSAQMMLISLLAVNAQIPVIVFTVFIMNVRHLLLSMNIAMHFTKYSYLENILIGILLTDESFSLVNLKFSKNEEVTNTWMNGLNITAYLAWIAATLFGALLGKMVPNPHQFGIDFALTAMFVALLVLQIEAMPKGKMRILCVVLTTVVVTMLIGMKFLHPNLAVLVAAVIGSTVGTVMEK